MGVPEWRHVDDPVEGRKSAPRKVATVLGSKVAKQLFHQVPALFQDLDRDIHMPPLRDAHSINSVFASFCILLLWRYSVQ